MVAGDLETGHRSSHALVRSDRYRLYILSDSTHRRPFEKERRLTETPQRCDSVTTVESDIRRLREASLGVGQVEAEEGCRSRYVQRVRT